jgi:hypothetical protein
LGGAIHVTLADPSGSTVVALTDQGAPGVLTKRELAAEVGTAVVMYAWNNGPVSLTPEPRLISPSFTAIVSVFEVSPYTKYPSAV